MSRLALIEADMHARYLGSFLHYSTSKNKQGNLATSTYKCQSEVAQLYRVLVIMLEPVAW
jgi:hypothetical protein